MIGIVPRDYSPTTRLGVLALAAVSALSFPGVSCSGAANPTPPPTTSPPPTNAMTAAAVAPAEGSVVVLPAEYPYIVPGGIVVPKDSGHVELQVDVGIAQDLPWAQLNVYLLTDDTTTEYCGQNTPDSPTWGLLQAGWSDSITISGFRVYRLPCEVTGFRVMLHTRNNGLLTPPTTAETVVESVVARSFTLTQ